MPTPSNAVSKIFPRKLTPTVKINYKGSHITLYSVSTLLKTAGISRRTLVRWEQYKVLPPPLFKPYGDVRYYTSVEISFYKEAVSIAKNMKKSSQRTLALRRAMIVAQDKILRYYKLK